MKQNNSSHDDKAKWIPFGFGGFLVLSLAVLINVVALQLPPALRLRDDVIAVGFILCGCIFLLASFLPQRHVRLFDVGEEDYDDFSWYSLACGITALAAGLLKAIPHLYFAARHLGRVPLAVTLTFVLVALGWLAHAYKQKSQYWYGFTEIVVAVLFILDRCTQLNSIDALPNSWGTLVGAVYFLARGLNNWREGEAKRRTPPYIETSKIPS